MQHTLSIKYHSFISGCYFFIHQFGKPNVISKIADNQNYMLKTDCIFGILICIIIVHRRKKSRDRRYKQSHFYKFMLFCACGFCPQFTRCNRNIHKNGNIQSSKLFPSLGLCLGMLIGIGMTLYSDPFLLFRACRGRCDDYRLCMLKYDYNC